MEGHDRIELILKEKGGQVWSISPEATVYEALETMANKGIGALLVTGLVNGYGLISERDYARKVILKGRASKDTLVRDIMTAPAVTVGPDCSVARAMQMMTDGRFRHLPVTDSDGKVLGMISIGDVVKWIITSQEKLIEQLHSYISGSAA